METEKKRNMQLEHSVSHAERKQHKNEIGTAKLHAMNRIIGDQMKP